ncbi:MAG: 16S rRNA (cytidine(1402)-2'-O)-methyltransferase [Elusimicrobia bacterium]|nr:16S rRNA (cytidine(1402)-2'-O)-methyltransferase [Elusimicrobiota bacterium]
MLHIVATPLGNLQDITLRALDVLKRVDVVYCEDTRRTRQLLSAFDIHKPLERYEEHNPRCLDKLMETLKASKEVALVSDGGTPAVSDPGYKIVARARAEGLSVASLPGCSAVAAAAAGCGFPADAFIFLGFLPRSSGRQRKILTEAAAFEKTMILFESPYRIVKTLGLLEEVLGAQTPAALGRELTKLHEEWLWGTVGEIRAQLAARAGVRGEITLALNPRKDLAP